MEILLTSIISIFINLIILKNIWRRVAIYIIDSFFSFLILDVVISTLDGAYLQYKTRVTWFIEYNLWLTFLLRKFY